MAFKNSVVWEVRSATGSNTNGGGFDPVSGSPGTDYSQQTSPQIAFTDLVIDGTTNTKITSVANPFTSAHVGNIINITSGTNFTVQRVQILSVSGVIATCDKAVGTTSSTGGHGNLGGALATLTVACAQSVANNTIYCVGSETKAVSLSLANSSSGGVNNPTTIIGYTTTRGDGGRFLLTTSTNSCNLVTYDGSQYLLQNIYFQCTAGSPGDGIRASTSGFTYDLCLDNCRISGFNHNIYCPYNVEYLIIPITLNNCQLDSATADGIYSSATIIALNSYFKSNASAGIRMVLQNQSSQTLFCQGCTFYNNTGPGINQLAQVDSATNNTPLILLNCNFHVNGGGYNCGTNGGAAISYAMINCVFDSCVGAINGCVTGVNTFTGIQYNNAFRNNTSFNRSNFPPGIGDITLTAIPWTNPSADDFTLNSTSGGGLLLKASGFQSTVM